MDRILFCPLGGHDASHQAAAFAEDGTRCTRFELGCLDRGEPPFTVLAGPSFEPGLLSCFRLYLPLLLGAVRARSRDRSFIVAHIAQTLDGRIACNNGHSQWISNEANLVHSHRLRALCDAVLVGSRTVHADDPKLTVRHVEGRNPIRVVLSGRGSALSGDEARHLFAGSGCLLVCSEQAADSLDAPDGVEVLALPGGESAMVLDAGRVCAALRERGLASVFLEGGGVSLSRFLDDGYVDLLHLHVAPVILGSGRPSFALPEALAIQDGRRMVMEHFELDREVLFECRDLAAAAAEGGEASGDAL